MEPFYEKNSFQALLKEKDENLYAQLILIKKKGLIEWVPLLSFDRGSHSGYPHLLNVEKNADKMISVHIKNGFSSGEIFLLLSSVFLHDIGKLVKSGEPHNVESETIIKESWAELNLPNERIAHYCALISYYHGIIDPNEKGNDIQAYYMTSLEPYGRLRIPLLCAILRIADEAENCWTRSVQKYLFQRIQKESKSLFKAVRRFVEDIEFCLPGECIILHVPSFNFEDKKLDKELANLNNMKEKIQNTIDCWSPILAEYGINYKKVYFEHKNSLLTKLEIDKLEIKKQKIGQVFQDHKDNRPQIKELFDSVMKLSLGSMGHQTFILQTFEAKLGKTFTQREKWLLERMNYITPYFHIDFTVDGKINVYLERKEIKKIVQEFGFN